MASVEKCFVFSFPTFRPCKYTKAAAGWELQGVAAGRWWGELLFLSPQEEVLQIQHWGPQMLRVFLRGFPEGQGRYLLLKGFVVNDFYQMAFWDLLTVTGVSPCSEPVTGCPPGALSHFYPGLVCVSIALGWCDDTQLQKPRSFLEASPFCLGSRFLGDAVLWMASWRGPGAQTGSPRPAAQQRVAAELSPGAHSHLSAAPMADRGRRGPASRSQKLWGVGCLITQR